MYPKRAYFILKKNTRVYISIYIYAGISADIYLEEVMVHFARKFLHFQIFENTYINHTYLFMRVYIYILIIEKRII